MNVKKLRLSIFFTTIMAIVALVVTFGPSIRNDMTLGLDLQGGFEIVYEVTPLNNSTSLPSMSAVARAVSKRVDVLGVSEPQIIIEGDNRIRVQLAGVSDQDTARRIISASVNLEFRDVNDNLLADATILTEGGASLSFDSGKPIVSLKIADKDKFFEITDKVSKLSSGNNLLVIWLDFQEGDSYRAEAAKSNPKYISAATVRQGFRSDVVIEGGFTEASARELADLINSGSLPVRMNEIFSNAVSAEFGLEAFEKTIAAGLVGVLLVMLAMVVVYHVPGIVAAFMLALYVLVVFTLYNSLGGVYTLPGIAALLLGVGMTVDANVVTFERIKDQLYLGKRLETAVDEGHRLAFWTIFDSQFTTFISATVMYLLGTGAIKGFATMLMVTVLTTLLVNVFITKFLLRQLVLSGKFTNLTLFKVKKDMIPDLSKGEERRYFGGFEKIDFVKISRKFILGSLVVLITGGAFGLFNLATSGDFLNFGVDFASGTKITVTSDEGFDTATLRQQFAQFGYDNIRVQFAGDNTAYVTTRETESSENLQALKGYILRTYGHPANDVVVTPVIGRELALSAVILSLVAWLLMLGYITFRFEIDYAIGTIVALVHDIGIVFALFAIFRLEFNIELIAVILAIIGYSVDDTIVVFDRIRHTLNNYPKSVLHVKDYIYIVNEAIAETLFRSIFNTFTTVLPILALLILGSREIFNFNIAMVFGLTAGAYSSIFIAAIVWLWLKQHRKPKAQKVKTRKKEDLDEMTIIGIND
ncbi:MAG: protein translocase subunit SecD [Erysipelotrichia bacterium]|jgi:SecD/SecF fusion protein|nr:protein translocase subunit SecD [Erysipelotrichia bacterium]